MCLKLLVVVMATSHRLCINVVSGALSDMQATAEQASDDAVDASQPTAAVKPRRRQYRSKPGIS